QVFGPGIPRHDGLLQDAALDEFLEPGGQNVAGGPETLLEFAEAALAQERIADDQERPPVADRIERAGDRTERMGQALAFHLSMALISDELRFGLLRAAPAFGLSDWPASCRCDCRGR